MHHTDNPQSGFDVSILGLGAMGSIMAHAFLKQGKRVAVWNRSPGKAEALVAAGAHLCESAAAALTASPVTVCVLLDDAAVRQTLEADGIAPALAGRTVINFSTGSEADGLAVQGLINQAGGYCVKGIVAAYPRNVGNPESYCIYTGQREAFEQHSALLTALAGNSLFLPWEEALAFAAMLHTYVFASMTAFYEAAGASAHFGQSLPKMARLISGASRFFIADAIEDAARRIEQEDFAGDQARLDVHASAFGYIAQGLHATGARTPIFDAVCQTVERAQSLGYGDQDIAATIKSFLPEAEARD